MGMEINAFKQQPQNVSNKTQQKLELVRKLDSNPNEYSQLEMMILKRFINEAMDDKISVKSFGQLVNTDLRQEYECIYEKTQEIRSMQKEQKHKFDKNT